MANTFAKIVFNLKKSIEYQDNAIVSRTVTQNGNSSLTIYAIDKNQSIATHSTPIDTVVQNIEGEVTVTISDKDFVVKEGEMILMPKDEPHSLRTKERAKIIIFKS